MEGKQEANNINGVKGVCFDGGIPECNGLSVINQVCQIMSSFFTSREAAGHVLV